MANGEIRYSREVSYNMGLPFCDTTLYRVKGKRRQPRALGKPTSEAQARVNERNAQMTFVRYANANFEEGRDHYITLTFDEGHRPATREEARRHASNFLRRVKRAWDRLKGDPSTRVTGTLAQDDAEKGGRVFKYLYVIEGGDGKRIHIHLLMTGGLTEARIRELWGKAEILNVRTLQASDKGYEALSVYLTKQGRLDGEHRWYGSRNLDKPEAAELNAGISAEDMDELARSIEDINAGVGIGVHTTAERYAPVEERYPGYYMAEAEAIRIEQFREWVIHVKLYRKDSAPGKREAKRRRIEERIHKSGQMVIGLGRGRI